MQKTLEEKSIEEIDKLYKRRVLATHKLINSRLPEIVQKIYYNSSLISRGILLRDSGIVINGVIHENRGGEEQYAIIEVGRLVDGSLIGKEDDELYLQIFKYENFNGRYIPDLEKVLDEYFI